VFRRILFGFLLRIVPVLCTTSHFTTSAVKQRLIVGPENTDTILVEAEELEDECEIYYFQDYGVCDRILGKIRM